MIGKYESMIVFAPNLSKEEIETENKKILSLIGELGGEYLKTDDWGKRHLAYEIKKFREGYYLINYFQLNTKKTFDVERHYRLNERIIRYNVLKLEAREEE